jgi:hypothetical protein
VLSEVHVLDMEQAATRLEELAESEQVALPDAAEAVIRRAASRQD